MEGTSLCLVSILLVSLIPRIAAFCEHLDLSETYFKSAEEGRYSIQPDETWCDLVKPVYKQNTGSNYIFHAAFTDTNNDPWAGWVVGDAVCDPSQPSIRAASDDPAPNVVSRALWMEVEGGVEYQTAMSINCTECEGGYWGSTCLNECVSCYHGKCNDTNGVCICAFGYSGTTCKGFSVGVKVALGVCGAVALVSIVIIVVCLWRKKKSKKKNKKMVSQEPVASTGLMK